MDNSIRSSIIDRNYTNVNSAKFLEILSVVHVGSNSNNHKSICLECWTLETRTTKKYDIHKFHKLLTPIDYAGKTIDETREKLLKCAVQGNYMKDEWFLNY